MKTIKLTFKQSKDLIFNGKELRVRRYSMVLYINYYGDKIIATDWSGTEVDVKVKIDECFE